MGEVVRGRGLHNPFKTKRIKNVGIQTRIEEKESSLDFLWFEVKFSLNVLVLITLIIYDI